MVAAGEDLDLEFKASIPAVDQIARHLAAFANASGGRLLLGIGEPGHGSVTDTVRGVDPSRALNSVMRAVERVEPRLEVKTEVVPVDGRHVVIADIAPSASAPVTAAGVAYIRKGAATGPATADDLLRHAAREAVARAPAGLNRDDLMDALKEALRGPTEAIERQGVEIQKLQASGGWQRQLAWTIIGAVLGTVLGVIATLLIQ
jgi:predicted HTH transcriptional regulator